jgi:hypothetical protein
MHKINHIISPKKVPVAERSKARVCGRSLAAISGSNTAEGMNVSFECCQVESSATGRSLFQRNPTDCGVSFCVI